MNLPTLSPRGIFVPTQLIFLPDLTPTALRTWMQLRCLAWSGWSTPPMTISELAAQLGIHTTRLSKHMAQLKEYSLLSWRTYGLDKIIISFPEVPASPGDHSQVRHSTNPEPLEAPEPKTHSPASYFPPKILGYLSYDDEPESQDDRHGLIHHQIPQQANEWHPQGEHVPCVDA